MSLDRLGFDQREVVKLVTDAFQAGMETLTPDDMEPNRMLAVVAGNVIAGVAKAVEANNARILEQLREAGVVGKA